MSDDLKDRLDLWFRAHLQGIRSTVIVFGVVVLCGVSSYFVTRCLNPSIPIPSAPPTLAPTITAPHAPATHIPSVTASLFPATATKLPFAETRTVTWTNTPSKTRTAVPATLTRTNTPTPTATAPMETIPAGRNLSTPHPLPNTGASQQEIQDMTATVTPKANTPSTDTASATPTPNRITLPVGCVYHSLYLEPGLGYDVLVFHCPSILTGVTPGAVGGTD